MSKFSDREPCPFCDSFIYRGGKYRRDLSKTVQVYRCNNLGDIDCPHGREPIARTKAQIRRLNEMRTDELEAVIDDE